MMNMLESRRCLSSLGLGTPRVPEPKGQLSFLADSASLLLQADDWHQKCSAAPHQHLVLHLFPWHGTSPHLAQHLLFPKPFHCRHTELFSPWQHPGPRCTCSCVILWGGIRIRECASPAHKVLFHSLEEHFCYFHHVIAESHEKRLCSCSWYS